jgi:hypothetical protein
MAGLGTVRQCVAVDIPGHGETLVETLNGAPGASTRPMHQSCATNNVSPVTPTLGTGNVCQQIITVYCDYVIINM